MAAAMLLAGCSFLSNTADPVWSTLSEEDAVKNSTTTPDAPSAAEVANIIDIAKGAGIDKIGLITQKIEAGQ